MLAGGSAIFYRLAGCSLSTGGSFRGSKRAKLVKPLAVPILRSYFGPGSALMQGRQWPKASRICRKHSGLKRAKLGTKPTDEQGILTDTIVALSSGALPAGVAVLRLSGPAASEVLRKLSGRNVPPPRHASLMALRDAEGGLLDHGLVLWFPGPNSFTGEDVVELQIHGGPAVVDATLGAITSLQLARLAEPGEFTRRAFDNGRLDLTAVEGLADLIAARTESQRKVALRQVDGGLHALAADWRTALVQALAHIEAAIDFSDEELPESLIPDRLDNLDRVRTEIDRALADDRCGELARAGVQVVLVGPPNVGKSSLLNRLARRDVAIVSPMAGTTRDVVEVTLDLVGVPVIVADTAGLRDSEDEIETAGVARAQARWRDADLAIYVRDARQPLLDNDQADLIGEIAMVLANKCDLVPGAIPALSEGVPVFPVSALTGDGIDAWISDLSSRVSSMAGVVGDAGIITRQRHRTELERASNAILRAHESPSVELIAEDIRLAVAAIGRLTGAVDVEDLLDVIFADFCIGK